MRNVIRAHGLCMLIISKTNIPARVRRVSQTRTSMAVFAQPNGFKRGMWTTQLTRKITCLGIRTVASESQYTTMYTNIFMDRIFHDYTAGDLLHKWNYSHSLTRNHYRAWLYSSKPWSSEHVHFTLYLPICSLSLLINMSMKPIAQQMLLSSSVSHCV